MTTTVAIVADSHINSSVALRAPIVYEDDSDEKRASKAQHWLWNSWVDFWDKVGKMPGRKMAVFNGDLGELDTKRRSTQIVSQNKATILRMAQDVLEPVLDVCGMFLFIRGTQAHTGKAGWFEEAIAQDIVGTIRCDPKKAPASWYHWQGSVEGVRFDIAHHATMGGLPWTGPNAATRLAALALHHYCVLLRIPPPHAVIRSHNHRYADSGGNFETFAVMTPCWTLQSEYVYRMGKELSVPDIGGLTFICEAGEYEYKRHRYELPGERAIWTKNKL
jgi:hypothetical protein